MSRNDLFSAHVVQRVDSPSILSTQLQDAPTHTPQDNDAKTATVLASPDPVAEQADSSQEQPEQPSTYARLQAALDELSPLLERANAALIGPSLDSSEPAMVSTCSCTNAEPAFVPATYHSVHVVYLSCAATVQACSCAVLQPVRSFVQVAVSSSMRPVEGDVRSASSLVQEQVLSTQGVPEVESELSASSLLKRNSAAAGSPAAVGAAARLSLIHI